MASHRHVLRYLTLASLLAVISPPLARTTEAATPWGLLAGRVIGRVEHMSQAQKGDQPGFDVATVILKADAGKVYATAIAMLHNSHIVHVTAEDAANRSVQFSNGQRSAGMTVTDLGPRLSQLLVASTTVPGESSATMQVVDGVLRVCQQMKVNCSVR